mmetsp:Transcript_25178/g.42152  ORF Transcript_25178/g.42152 Transcript_25178/m.42152 type:complete len:212 (-) Transcript_25178:302-937(-)
MEALSFEQSGQGEFPLTLDDVRKLAFDLGYKTPASADPSKPLAMKTDTGAFFKQYGVNAFSVFRKKFFTDFLKPIGPGGVALPSKSQAEILAAKKPVLVKPEDIPDVSQYDDLVSKFKGLKWRIISRPGGATMKPTDWYRLEAAISQVGKGDNTEEKPMWAARGGLDFDGRELWDQYTALKGKTQEEAKQFFCLVWAEAHADPKANFRLYG